MATLAHLAAPHQDTRSLAAQALGSLLYLDRRSHDGINPALGCPVQRHRRAAMLCSHRAQVVR